MLEREDERDAVGRVFGGGDDARRLRLDELSERLHEPRLQLGNEGLRCDRRQVLQRQGRRLPGPHRGVHDVQPARRVAAEDAAEPAPDCALEAGGDRAKVRRLSQTRRELLRLDFADENARAHLILHAVERDVDMQLPRAAAGVAGIINTRRPIAEWKSAVLPPVVWPCRQQGSARPSPGLPNSAAAACGVSGATAPRSPRPTGPGRGSRSPRAMSAKVVPGKASYRYSCASTCSPSSRPSWSCSVRPAARPRSSPTSSASCGDTLTWKLRVQRL